MSELQTATKEKDETGGLGHVIDRLRALRLEAVSCIPRKAFDDAELFTRKLFELRPDCPWPAVSGRESGKIDIEWKELCVVITERYVYSPIGEGDDIAAAAQSLDSRPLTSIVHVPSPSVLC